MKIDRPFFSYFLFFCLYIEVIEIRNAFFINSKTKIIKKLFLKSFLKINNLEFTHLNTQATGNGVFPFLFPMIFGKKLLAPYFSAP